MGGVTTKNHHAALIHACKPAGGKKKVWNCYCSWVLFASAGLSVFPAICSILELEASISTVLQQFERLIFDDIYNILVLKLFMLEGILYLGTFRVCVGLFLGLFRIGFYWLFSFLGGLVWGIFRIGLGSMQGWFKGLGVGSIYIRSV